MIDTQALVSRIATGNQDRMSRGKDNLHGSKSRFRPDRLKALMKDRGLDQSDLAKGLGVTQSQVSKWLTGTHIPSVDTLVSIADYFGISMDYFADRIGENQAFYEVPELSPDEWSFILSIRDGSFPAALRKLAEEMAKREEESNKKGTEEG